MRPARMLFGEQTLHALHQNWKRTVAIVRVRLGEKQIFFLLQRLANRSIITPSLLKLIKTEQAGDHRDCQTENADNDFKHLEFVDKHLKNVDKVLVYDFMNQPK